MPGKQKSFVAYSSRDEANARIILEGVQKANAVDACNYHYEPWPFNDIAGKPLISPIVENIDAAPFVVADITPDFPYELWFPGPLTGDKLFPSMA